MNTNESNPIAIALDLLLRDRPKGGQRSRVLRLSRDVLLPLCQDIANPEIANLHVFDGLQKEIGDKCPGRDALYRFADAFMKLYRNSDGRTGRFSLRAFCGSIAGAGCSASALSDRCPSRSDDRPGRTARGAPCRSTSRASGFS